MSGGISSYPDSEPLARFFSIFPNENINISKQVTPVSKEGGPGFYLEGEPLILELSL